MAYLFRAPTHSRRERLNIAWKGSFLDVWKLANGTRGLQPFLGFWRGEVKGMDGTVCERQPYGLGFGDGL